MDIKKQVDYFKKLPYETKRNKVLEMLKQLQWTHEVFAMFYRTVDTLSHVSETMLLNIYKTILDIATDIEKWNKEAAQNKIKKMGEVLLTIKKQEEMEREREGSPDEILKNM